MFLEAVATLAWLVDRPRAGSLHRVESRLGGGGDVVLGDNGALSMVFVGEESGQWAVLLRWPKGYSAAPHKHLSGAHTFVLSGRLEVRDGVLEAGDYLYERNGMIHESTTALEDTEYIFIADGPLVFYDENGVTGYLGWEEISRMRAAHEEAIAAA